MQARWIIFAVILCAGIILLSIVAAIPGGTASAFLHGTPQPTATPQEVVLADNSPTYYQQIKPIFDQHCAACHLPGGIGHSLFALDDMVGLSDIAPDIAFLAGQRTMPPWMPGPDSPPLQHERKLSDNEIALIEAWAKAGGPMGDPASATTTQVEVRAVRADLTVQMPEVYMPNEAMQDDYRCFLIDPELVDDVFITGYTIEPGEATVVHHAILFKLEGPFERRAQRIDERDERPGWQCFGGSGVGSDEVLGTWTPGSVPVFHLEGTGHYLEKDALFVLQVHYNLLSGAKPDQTKVVLQLADKDENLEHLSSVWLQAPVEIPCPADVESPACDREAAIARVESYEGGTSRGDLNFLLQACHKTLEDYIHQDASAVTSECTMRSWLDARLVEILPHMHTRGSSIRVEVNPDTPDAQVLIDIPNWDFHWQGSYHYQEPIAIHAGDNVRITCVWDNSQGENPSYIVWGEGTSDEMCIALLTFAPAE